MTGCGSSGSTYVARLLQRNRIAVTHDASLGQDGIVTNACDGKEVWVYAFGRGGHRDYVLMKVPVTEFDHVVHLVRDPLKTIGSVLAKWERFGRVWKHVVDTMPGVADDAVTPAVAARYWLVWNQRIQDIAATRVRFEDVLTDRVALAAALGRPLRRPLDPTIPVQPSGATTYPTWAELSALDQRLASDIAALARSYGYDVPDLEEHGAMSDRPAYDGN